MDMPLSHKFKTIGNGVPVKLATAVASSILCALRVAQISRSGGDPGIDGNLECGMQSPQ
jgi:hypothetical protein